MDSEVFSRIRGYLADQLEVEPEKITPDSDIVNDFGADSLDVIDMITPPCPTSSALRSPMRTSRTSTPSVMWSTIWRSVSERLSPVLQSVRKKKWQTIRKKMVEAITAQEVDFAQWYTDICLKAELVDYSSVKGFMVMRPYGYAIWENIQKIWMPGSRPPAMKTWPCPC